MEIIILDENITSQKKSLVSVRGFYIILSQRKTMCWLSFLSDIYVKTDTKQQVTSLIQ